MLIASVLLLCAAGFLAAGGSQEDGKSTLEQVKEQGYFTLGLDDSFPPMGFRSDDNEIVGFDIDMAREVAERMEVELRLRPVDWDGVILSLNKGDIDMVWNGMTITESRQEKIDFSDPYLANRQVVIVRSDAEIEDKEDLAGKVIGFQMGSSSETAVNSEPEVAESFDRVKKYSNNVEALLDLKAGRVDAIVVDEIMGRYYIAKREGVYRVLEEDFGREEYGIGFRKEDDAFRKRIDEILDEMRADGTAAEISRDWFGEDIVLE
jgi:polar amino acid transport system substrate-binding protein